MIKVFCLTYIIDLPTKITKKKKKNVCNFETLIIMRVKTW